MKTKQTLMRLWELSLSLLILAALGNPAAIADLTSDRIERPWYLVANAQGSNCGSCLDDPYPTDTAMCGSFSLPCATSTLLEFPKENIDWTQWQQDCSAGTYRYCSTTQTPPGCNAREDCPTCDTSGCGG